MVNIQVLNCAVARYDPAARYTRTKPAAPGPAPRPIAQHFRDCAVDRALVFLDQIAQRDLVPSRDSHHQRLVVRIRIHRHIISNPVLHRYSPASLAALPLRHNLRGKPWRVALADSEISHRGRKRAEEEEAEGGTFQVSGCTIHLRFWLRGCMFNSYVRPFPLVKS